MIMAIPPYVGLSVSILNNSESPYSYVEKEETESRSPEMKKDSSLEESLTQLPKKRSFDVAFLISPDDSKQSRSSKVEINRIHHPEFEIHSYENETIKSAFKKVGIGFSKLADSRSPSPNDPARTPSPYKPPFPDKKPLPLPDALKQKRDAFPYGSIISQRPRLQSYPKELDKSSIFLGSNLINPVSVGLGRQNFIPAPIFGGSPILPTSFVTASLLPPSLAALTLPAQNVCAKCNVSFRMTSDLVYHMRSHHKNDHSSSDQVRRRRELEKLKCPVCNESFRERHHLTRHMTAHQDKEGDNLDPEGGRKDKVDKPRISGEFDQ